jgi:hypothetical protein
MMRRLGVVPLSVWLLLACSESPDGAHAWAARAAPRPESYAKVMDILQRSCAYVRCHDGPILGGNLRLSHDSDYAGVLIGVKACQYDRMARVEPHDPEHSWLMLKLTAAYRGPDDPYANYIEFTPDADWDAELRGCRDRTDDGQPLFGQRMPLTAPNMLPEDELTVIREWIEAGAPVE